MSFLAFSITFLNSSVSSTSLLHHILQMHILRSAVPRTVYENPDVMRMPAVLLEGCG